MVKYMQKGSWDTGKKRVKGVIIDRFRDRNNIRLLIKIINNNYFPEKYAVLFFKKKICIATIRTGEA